MGFSAFTDWTVEEMVTNSDQTKSGQTTGAYLRWICTKDGASIGRGLMSSMCNYSGTSIPREVKRTKEDKQIVVKKQIY
jgi:hypothetical protein